MRRFADASFLVVLTAWIGGLWTVGYLVAPVLFSALSDRQLAGQLAGRMFEVSGWLGLGCGAYVLAFLLIRHGLRALKRSTPWLVLAMMGMTAASLFGIQPLMVQMKADALPRDVMESLLRDRFVAWHGISSILYLVESILGVFVAAGAARSLK